MRLIHKLLSGDGAEVYLPFALARLRALEALNPQGFFSQTFVVGDATINVRQDGKVAQYIRIEAGGGIYFEFATSGLPVLSTAISGGAFAYDALNVGVTIAGKSTKAVVLGNARGQNSRVDYLWQVQLLNEEPRYYQPDAKQRKRYYYPDIVYSSFAPPHSYSGFPHRVATMKAYYATFGTLPGSQENFVDRDIDYDQSYSHTKGFQNPQTRAYLQIPADWPREAGRQVVVDQTWGSRSFGILIDAFGQFHVFPESSITTVNGTAQNVPVTDVKMLQPPMPYWVVPITQKARDAYTGDLVKWGIEQPDYAWQFRHDGTKACAVMFGRSAFDNDSTYWATNPDPNTPWTPSKFTNTLLPHLFGDASHNYQSPYTSTASSQRYFFGAGIVEASIKITLTGPNPIDFTLDIQATSIRDPNTSEYAALFAGYVWMDKAGSFTAGDLCCIDIEGFGGGTSAGGQRNLLSARNLTMGTEVFTTKAHPIIGVDMSTLSLALRLTDEQRHVRKTSPNRQGGSSTIDWVVDQFCVWVIQGGVTKGFIFPDTMPVVQQTALQQLATYNYRAEINNILSDPNWAYIPLAHPKDGWLDSEWNNYRDQWSFAQHFWYNETWCIDDPDIFFHGSSYPNQGYVTYRVAPGGFTPSADANLRYKILSRNRPPGNLSADHLMFCTNPRWGWNYYAGAQKTFNLTNMQTTFYTHPSGSWAFFSDLFIYNPVGCPNWGTDNAEHDSSLVGRCNTLDAYDVTQIEHCILDKVHLEIHNNGKTRTIDSTFIDYYNKAVTKGLDNKTLDPTKFKTVTKADMRGTFTKGSNTGTIATGETVGVLELKFTWHGVDWYHYEPGVWGTFDAEPTLIFPINGATPGNIIGLSLLNLWATAPFNMASNNYNFPGYVDAFVPSKLQVRFSNPLIVQG